MAYQVLVPQSEHVLISGTTRSLMPKGDKNHSRTNMTKESFSKDIYLFLSNKSRTVLHGVTNTEIQCECCL